MRMRSQAYFAYIMSPWHLTFDLMTQESTQFIGSARYIHDQSLAGIHQSVLMIMPSQAVFAYIMSPATFDLWPYDPKIESVHRLCKIHTWPKFGRNPSIGSWDNAITSCFCIHNEPCDLWPLTSWPQNLISSSALQDTYMTKLWQESIDWFFR